MKTRQIVAIALLAGGLCTAFSASADIWCNGGTVVNAADVQWDHADLLNETQGMSPTPFVPNPDYNLATRAGENYCQAYAGGAGRDFGVPGNGTVVLDVYAPYNYGPGPSYDLEDGLSFECRKCYAIPPLPPIRLPFLY